jgi:hypothetical protein
MTKAYEVPTLRPVGSLAELTLTRRSQCKPFAKDRWEKSSAPVSDGFMFMGRNPNYS